MAKLTTKQLEEELQIKGFTLVDNSQYQNMKSDIIIKCCNNHTIHTNLDTFRKNSFYCPLCDTNNNYERKTNIPDKKGYRIVAFDQATEKMGVSVFDDGQLVYCDLFFWSGDLVTRLCKIKKLLENTIIPIWKPDMLIFEDIQYQNNISTFKVLAMLLGICISCARCGEIPYDIILSKVWRSGMGINGKTRPEEKRLAKQKVKELFNINTSDDVAEAILIGKYASRIYRSQLF